MSSTQKQKDKNRRTADAILSYCDNPRFSGILAHQGIDKPTNIIQNANITRQMKKSTSRVQLKNNRLPKNHTKTKEHVVLIKSPLPINSGQDILRGHNHHRNLSKNR